MQYVSVLAAAERTEVFEIRPLVDGGIKLPFLVWRSVIVGNTVKPAADALTYTPSITLKPKVRSVEPHASPKVWQSEVEITFIQKSNEEWHQTASWPGNRGRFVS